MVAISPEVQRLGFHAPSLRWACWFMSLLLMQSAADFSQRLPEMLHAWRIPLGMTMQ
jgi:uncharacterized membrane protein YfhO